MPEQPESEKSSSQQSADRVAYERTLRAMPPYELKAEYIARFGGGWDLLTRPRQESAIAALLQDRAKDD